MKEYLYNFWLKFVVWMYIIYRSLKVIAILFSLVIGFVIAYLLPVFFINKLTSTWLFLLLYLICFPIGMTIVILLVTKVDWDRLLKFDQ